MWHLHPDAINRDGDFAQNLPSVDAGHYQVFADVETSRDFRGR